MNSDVSSDFAGSGIHLNNASVSLMPLQSIRAMGEFLEEYCSLGPDSDASDELVRKRLAGARQAIAEAVSCQPDEVVLTQSTTDGVNMVAGGLGLEEGSNVVIRGMAHEHHSNLYPWLGTRAQVRSMQVDADGFFDMAELESMVDGDTGLVALSHALYNTGAILPVAEAARALRGRAPLFVDSAQSAGCLEVDASAMGCDFMAFNGSKWLCGPMGTGIFYCRRDSAGMLEPQRVGGESAMLHEGRLVHKEMPARFQAGFRNYAGAVGMESSVRYLLRFGIGRIRQKNMRLAEALRGEISRIPGSTIYGPGDPGMRTSIVSFNIKGVDPARAVARLQEQGIVLALREMFDEKMVRASPHFFNTESEIARVAEALRKL